MSRLQTRARGSGSVRSLTCKIATWSGHRHRAVSMTNPTPIPCETNVMMVATPRPPGRCEAISARHVHIHTSSGRKRPGFHVSETTRTTHPTCRAAGVVSAGRVDAIEEPPTPACAVRPAIVSSSPSGSARCIRTPHPAARPEWRRAAPGWEGDRAANQHRHDAAGIDGRTLETAPRHEAFSVKPTRRVPDWPCATRRARSIASFTC